ncbi:DUF2653 family protein [Lysinibacillus sphaericus]|uniref:Protein of uncharacterized function (DUF2653) n=4 Tax=Lysinibacillus TaxID=400634 RepID=A0A2S0JVY5_LYSSH|nr:MULTISPECIES: DUF2653 family protein [Lysinibacillus]AHN23453.1 hypothetical protein T479_21125 [Lysinibacillus varians]AVK95300.1 hypothetical protein LS41612_02890 [Lysinibacillus sphaericus]MCS1383020.1 YxcD family protein [Lysinibacillus sphaericus]MED4542094.1 DUF2653 family protein [Lysinibacillus sphaericus]TKI18173.1 DUF2653 family protein [Lysinibacillus sphaericus]
MAQIINEQDIINAICLSQAYHLNVRPEDVLVELTYEDETGFGAEVETNGQIEVLNTAAMIGALRVWIKDVLHGDPFSTGIELILDDEEGIIAKLS